MIRPDLAELVETRRCTYVQAFYRYPCEVDDAHPSGWYGECREFVVFETDKKLAIRRAHVYAIKTWGGDHLHEIFIYPKHPVKCARRCLTEGRHDG